MNIDFDAMLEERIRRQNDGESTVMVESDRPRNWNEYIGQTRMKTRLETHIAAAKARKAPLDHLLLTGPPGVGKTAIASLVAKEMGYEMESMVMPVKMDILRNKCRKPRRVIFLDEIHRLKKQQEELLSALEDKYFQLPNGHRQPLVNITFIGATTEPVDVIPPLYDRFTLKPVFEPYTQDEMEKMVLGMAARNDVTLPASVVPDIACASNGIPRNARQLVLAARALATTKKTYTAADVLDLAGLTVDGLSDQHVDYLRAMASLGGRAGLTTMVTILRLHPKVVNELERVLVQKELITFRATGRELLPEGWTTVEAA